MKLTLKNGQFPHRDKIKPQPMSIKNIDSGARAKMLLKDELDIVIKKSRGIYMDKVYICENNQSWREGHQKGDEYFTG